MSDKRQSTKKSDSTQKISEKNDDQQIDPGQQLNQLVELISTTNITIKRLEHKLLKSNEESNDQILKLQSIITNNYE